MSNKIKTMLQIRRILQLFMLDKTSAQVASELDISINTVKKYRNVFLASGIEFKQLLSLEDSALQLITYPQKTDINTKDNSRQVELQKLLSDYVQKLHNNKHLTRELIWIDYRKQHCDGYSYSQFCEYLQRHILLNKVVMHLEHKPGEVLQIDFAGDKLSYTNKNTGEIISCVVLVCTMPYSSLVYVEALPDQSQFNLIASLNNCLSYLGGVPLNIKSDNMKQIVTTPNRYEPVFTEVINQFALYYQTSITATRVAKPRDKASVERHVQIVYQKIYAIIEQKQYYSLKQLNADIFELMEKLNNSQMQKKDYSRRQLFEQMERPVLLELPLVPFEIKHQRSAKVMQNYHVILGEDWHNYSVPHKYRSKQVMLVYDQQNVEIYHDMQRIAVHTRCRLKHGYTTIEEHMPANHQARKAARGYTPEYFLTQAQNIGINTFKVIDKILQQRQFTEQSYNSCLGILRLKEKYSIQRLEKACGIALSSYRISYGIIHSILKNNKDKIEPDTNQSIITQNKHANIRGKEIYCDLFNLN